MSKKPSKSIQAIIITLIAGMIIPKIFDISGNALLDKFLWKGVLSASFSVATIIVGLLYAGKFITGKVAGGKSRKFGDLIPKHISDPQTYSCRTHKNLR